MSELILHHYEGSPFSEKVRLILGFKGLTWRSVNVPMMMPKPDVVALTGGYRRTPFLQIGADIYCDTALMCRVIDAMAPHPALFPVAASGLQHVLAQWADTTLFWTAIPFAMQPAGAAHMFASAPADFLKAFGADRMAMGSGLPRSTVADAAAQLKCYFGWLESELCDQRPYLLGAQPCIADFSVAQSVWYLRRVPPVAGILGAFPQLLQWYERMAALGHGTPERMSSAEALALAAQCPRHVEPVFEPEGGFQAGDAVTVAATDYATDLVPGTLVGLSAHEVVIERHDERAGRVHVHFPRIGYQIKKPKPGVEK